MPSRKSIRQFLHAKIDNNSYPLQKDIRTERNYRKSPLFKRNIYLNIEAVECKTILKNVTFFNNPW